MATGSDRIDTIVDLLARRCADHAELIAVDGAGGPLRYRELWERSGKLAQDLVARGVRVEDRVGVWAAQSADLLVGILGIWRAGAAYVPLDPTLPEGRLSLLVRDAGLRLLVAPDEQLGAAKSIVAEAVGSSRPVGSPAELPDVGGGEAAYVIYTSGSTGVPKGVVVEHRSLARLMEWVDQECEIGPGQRLLGTAAPSFDASVPMLLFPLLRGATFVALDAETARDARALLEEIRRVAPTILVTAPTMLRMLMEVGWSGDEGIEVWTGGERTAPDVIAYLAPRVRVLCNWYGPTETTVQVALGRLAAGDEHSPVRTQAPHATCLLLDEQLAPVDDGTPGELVVIGEALARGYLNDPVLTARHFVTIHHEGRDVRAYRTGDLAVRRPDGSLELLGRRDVQLNVRGYRVEPREVEETLRSHPKVAEAVVVATEAPVDADRQLVAYVKAEPGLAGSVLRRHAAKRLPAHLVPLVVLVDEYPMTTSGKVDRPRLSRLATEDHEPAPRDATAQLARATELERTVASIFADVLSLPMSRVGLEDDFFELGGTSLRSLRLFVQLEEHLGVRLPLSTLTVASTPSTLAAAVAAQRRRGSDDTKEEPRHEWERILSALWRDVLRVDAVARTDSFFDLGGSPSDAQRMLDQLHDGYGVHVALREFERAPTVERLATLVGRRVRRSVLVPLTTDGEGPALFLITGAGGLAVTFLPLARLLGPGQTVFGVQTHGIERRAVPDYTLKQTTAHYLRAIREVQPHGPYLLGGHSLGGVHALNAAHLLRDAGEEVALLAIFDSHLTRRMAGGRRRAGDDGPAGMTSLTGLPRLKTVVHLPFVGIHTFRGTAQFEVFAALGEIQAALCGPLRPYDGRAVLFLSDDAESSPIESRWGRLLCGEWRTARVPGTHLAMLERTNIAAAAGVLREELAAVRAATATRA